MKSYAYTFIMIILLVLSFVLMFFARIKHRRLRIEVKADRKEMKE